MQRRKFTRRKLLQTSAAYGAAALAGALSQGAAGCGSREKDSLASGKWRELPSPVPTGSISPRVTAQPDGSVLLSWLEPGEDRTASLRFSIWRDARWTASVAIASNLRFSRDQASAPEVLPLSATTLVAHWSQRVSPDQQPNDEIELYMAVSSDAGAHWASPVLVNRSAAQPGEDNAYASAVALDPQRAEFIWLDGRRWRESRRVQLFSRIVSVAGPVSEAQLLDPDTCTCCSTSVAKTSQGLLAAYRGHTPENIRDISVVRFSPASWSQPRIPLPDHWHIEACPVNGPHLDVIGSSAALIWFAAPNDQPSVKLAFSRDGGERFAPPVRLDTATAVGRTRVILLDDGSAAGFWLELNNGITRLVTRRVRDDGQLGAPLELASGANFGYPHAARAKDGIVAAWSQKNPVSQVHVGLLQNI